MSSQTLYFFTMSKNKSIHAPICQAIVICDNIIKEENTHKLSLMGLFNSISASSFPTRHARMHIFISLTNYLGDTEGKLHFKDPKGNTIAEIQGPITFHDKLATVELNIIINGMIFPEPGVYTIEFLVAHQLVASRKIQVTERKAS